MALSRSFFVAPGKRPSFGIKGIDLEVVPVRSGWRAWAVVTDRPRIIEACAAPFGNIFSHGTASARPVSEGGILNMTQ